MITDSLFNEFVSHFKKNHFIFNLFEKVGLAQFNEYVTVADIWYFQSQISSFLNHLPNIKWFGHSKIIVIVVFIEIKFHLNCKLFLY